MQITRDEVVARSYEWPEQSIPYSMSGLYLGYRRDCSGYVSYCLRLPAPGYSTVNLPDVCTKIPSSELQPGDLIGKMGAGTGGANGHVQMFIGWTPTGLSITEQAGGMNGPWHHDIKRISPGYECYRYNDIVDASAPSPEELSMAAIMIQDDTGIAILWTGANELIFQNVVTVDMVEAWKAAGVPGPYAVPSIGAYGAPARTAVRVEGGGGASGPAVPFAISLSGSLSGSATPKPA